METLTDLYFINLIVSVLFPIVVAAVTKANTLGRTKAYVLLGLSALNGVAIGLQAHGSFEGFEWKAALVGALVSFVISAATHAGLLKPTGLTGSEGVVAQKTTNFGV